MVPAAAIPVRSVSTCMIAVQPETRQREPARHITASTASRHRSRLHHLEPCFCASTLANVADHTRCQANQSSGKILLAVGPELSLTSFSEEWTFAPFGGLPSYSPSLLLTAAYAPEPWTGFFSAPISLILTVQWLLGSNALSIFRRFQAPQLSLRSSTSPKP